MNKLLKLITGLRLAIVLIVLLATYSIIGTLLPQGMPESFYPENYGSFGHVITTLQFDRVYSSVTFGFLIVLFMINLIGCSLNILPAQLKRVSKPYFPSLRDDTEMHDLTGVDKEKLQKIIRGKGYRVAETENGFRAAKHRAGHLGSSVTHLGIVIVVAAGFLGNLYAEEGFFNMLPGDIRGFPDAGFSLRLDDFYLKFREDGSVEQYYSDLVVMESEDEVRSKTIWVNQPLKHNGFDFYQTSFGWASELTISDSNKEVVARGMLRNTESFFYQPEHLTVQLYGFFPDIVISDEGMPMTASHRKREPYYAVVLYRFNEHIGSYIVEPGQGIPYGEMTIMFPDSYMYTGLTYRKDYGYPFVLVGSGLLLLGLLLSFYAYPKYLVAEDNGLRAASRQNLWGLNYQLRQYVARCRAAREE